MVGGTGTIHCDTPTLVIVELKSFLEPHFDTGLKLYLLECAHSGHGRIVAASKGSGSGTGCKDLIESILRIGAPVGLGISLGQHQVNLGKTELGVVALSGGGGSAGTGGTIVVQSGRNSERECLTKRFLSDPYLDAPKLRYLYFVFIFVEF